MGKSLWTGRQMTAAEYVGRAAFWSREMTRWRTRCPGDTDNAMREIARDYKLNYWLLWRLRFRLNQIRTIGVDIYVRLETAYHRERERQLRLLGEAIEAAPFGTDPHTLESASRLVGRSEGAPPPPPLHAKRLAADDED